MAKRKCGPGVTWAKSKDGFVPHYRWRGKDILGPERPWPRFLEGERMTVARYFLCLICEDLFGEAPLTYLGEDMTDFVPNEDFDSLPFMVEDPDSPAKWRMNDGNPDVMGIFKVEDQFEQKSEAKGP